MTSPIILAVDTSNFSLACKWIETTRDYISIFKLGLEFYLNFGTEGVSHIKKQYGVDIFLDLKLHDIPHTVSGAVKAISHLEPRFLTVHAAGGGKMIKEAVAVNEKIDITAVTILTSLSEEDLRSVGFSDSALDSAIRLGKLAIESGARALVCSPLEVEAMRKAVGSQAILITPGVRPTSLQRNDDQNRTMTPKDAVNAGSNFLVIGRPITEKWKESPDAMVRSVKVILSELSHG